MTLKKNTDELYFIVNEKLCNKEQNLIESWLPVLNYEGLYEVSNIGNVRSCEKWTNGRHFMPRNIRPAFKHRYPTVTLYKNGKPKCHQVHRLVASTFIRPPKNDTEFVRHKDGSRTNNCVDNLEYGSAQENTRDIFRINGSKLASLTTEQVLEIKKRTRKQSK